MNLGVDHPKAAVVAIDAVDWLAHLGNHRINSLWRLHAAMRCVARPMRSR